MTDLIQRLDLILREYLTYVANAGTDRSAFLNANHTVAQLNQAILIIENSLAETMRLVSDLRAQQSNNVDVDALRVQLQAILDSLGTTQTQPRPVREVLPITSLQDFPDDLEDEEIELEELPVDFEEEEEFEDEDEDYDDEDEDDEDEWVTTPSTSPATPQSPTNFVKNPLITEVWTNVEDTAKTLFVFVKYSHLPWHYRDSSGTHKLIASGASVISTRV